MPPTPFRRPKRLILDELKKCGAVAVIRAEVTEQLPETVAALLAGGLRAIEITLTTPDGVGVIAELAARYSRDDILLGAGTVLDPEEAAAAIAAGAEYIVSPSIELDVIAYCRDVGVASIPGAYTPTEVRAAVKAGADVVKIFPASVGGPKYIQDLRGPLPGARLMPSGGVSFETVAPFFAAGAFAVAVGSLLVDKELMRERKFDQITANTCRFMDLVAASRPE